MTKNKISKISIYCVVIALFAYGVAYQFRSIIFLVVAPIISVVGLIFGIFGKILKQRRAFLDIILNLIILIFLAYAAWNGLKWMF